MSLGDRRSASMRRLEQMPVIEEDEDDGVVEEVPPVQPVPPVPEKSPRRSQLGGRLPYTDPGYPPPAYINLPSRNVSAHEQDLPAAVTIGMKQDLDPTSSTTDAASASDIPLKPSRTPGWTFRRGGWGCFALCALLGILTVLALGLGLGLGLGLKRQNNEQSSLSPTNESLPMKFPAGSYAFNTALARVTTGCTSNPAAFRCYPYSTYNQSHTGSSSIFYWTIDEISGAGDSTTSLESSSSPSSGSSYQISSEGNLLAPEFSNVSLPLLDRGLTTERLVFSFSMRLAVVPAKALDGSKTAGTCYYNNTVMSATIWMRRQAEFSQNATSSATSGATNITIDDTNGANSTTSSSKSTNKHGTSTASTGGGGKTTTTAPSLTTALSPTPAPSNYPVWPFAVEIRQVSKGDEGIPDCRDANGQPLKNLELTGSVNDECSCAYRNFGLDD